MKDNNETPDAIVKEIRSLVQEARKYPRDVEITTADAEDWADRLEVAIARERNARINDIHNALYAATRLPGNAAAMREALEFAERRLTDARCDENFGEDAMFLSGCMGVVAEKCRAALAKPPRNCDRFNKLDCVDAFIRELGDGEIDIDKAAPEQYDAFMQEHWFLFKIWLYANAKKEGDKQQ